jgi:hypothetical protein
MEDILELAPQFGLCPTPWKNFVSSLMKANPDWENCNATIIVNNALQDYHAVKDGLTVKFNNPAYKTWFILKWSME